MKIFIFFLYLTVSPSVLAVSFSSTELATLEQASYVLKLDASSNTGSIVFDVKEDINDVFNKIIAFKNYPKIIDEIEKVNIYQRDEQTIKVNFFVSEYFISFNNHVIHHINKKNHTVTWQLDKTKSNYFLKMNGSWRLLKLKNKTRVIYSNQLEFATWIPNFIKDYFFEDGLVNSTKWLRKKHQ